MRSYLSVSVSYRTSLLFLLLSSLAPLLPNLLYLSGFDLVLMDLTPLGYVLSGILIAWTLVRHSFLQREPVPLELLLQRLPDAVLLLDLKGQVLEANLAAVALFGPDIKGLPLARFAPELSAFETGLAAAPFERAGRRYQVQLEPLAHEDDRRLAQLLSLRDVSGYIDATERLERQSAFQEALLECMRSLLEADAGSKVYQLVLERAIKVIPDAEAGSVVLQQPDGLFTFVASVGFDLEVLSQVRLELFYGENLYGEPTLTTDLAGFNARSLDPEKLALIANAGLGAHYKVSLGPPVFLDGELLAFLSLDNATDPKAFGPATRRLAELFAKHIGAALQKARFKGQLERAISAQTLLARVERLLLRTTELSRFFPLLAEELLGVDQLAIYIRKKIICSPRLRQRPTA